MDTDIGTNPPASAGAAGVQDGNPPGYEAGAGPSDADQGLADQSDGDLHEGEEGDQAPELDEFEHEGLKHQVPKALRELLDKGKTAEQLQADYTRKTQEHADAVRAREQQWAEREAQFAQREQASQLLTEGRAALKAVDLQLKQYEGVNWALAAQQDPTTANQHWMAYSQLKDERQKIAGHLQQAEHEYTTQASQTAANRVRETVSKWTAEEQKAVNEAAPDYRLTPQVLTSVFGQNPMLLTILRDAAMHRQATKAATAAAARAKPAAPAAQPAAQLPQGGRSQGPKSITDPNLSDAEWNRLRRQQISRRNKR